MARVHSISEAPVGCLSLVSLVPFPTQSVNSLMWFFLDFLKNKLQDRGRLAYNFDIGSFFTQSASSQPSNQFLPQSLDTIPARITSDQSVNNFFQEYHALFPIIHRPTFLKEYEKLGSLCEASVAPSQALSNHSITQLYLVFAIGARNSSVIHLLPLFR